MALDFPTSPALNQTYTFGSYTWRWDGTSWVGAVPIVNATINNTTIGAVTPSTGAFTTVTATTPIAGTSGGTGVNNGANTITLAGNVTHAGAFTQSFTATANTSLTLPVTGTLATLAGSEALSNKTITASAFNGTVGATTPSTVAGTTIAASGGFTANQTANNVSNGFLAVAVGGAINGGMFHDGTGLVLRENGVSMVKVTGASGLAVTGALSASGQLTVTGAAQNPFGSTFTPTAWGTSSVDINHANGGILAVYYNGTAKGYFAANSGTAAISLNTQGDGTINQNVNGTTRTSVTSTGLAVTGALSATDNSSVTKNTNGTTSFSVSNVSTGTSAFAAYYLTNSNGTNQANIGLLGGSYTSVVGWDVQSALAISNVTAGGISIAARSGSSSIRNYIGDGTAAITTVSSTGLAVTGTTTSSSDVIISSGNYLRLKNTANSAFASINFDGTNVVSNYGLAVSGIVKIQGAGTFGSASYGLSLFNNNNDYKIGFDNVAGTRGLIRYNVDTISTVHGHMFSAGAAGSQTDLMFIRGDGDVKIYNLGTGLVYSNSGSLTSTNPSDARLKTDITDLGYGLSSILALRPVSYKWKSDTVNQGTQYGFIAQEVQTVMPDLVKEFETTEDGEKVIRLGLEKEGIYAAMVKAMQELNANLVAELQFLRQRVAVLESK